MDNTSTGFAPRECKATKIETLLLDFLRGCEVSQWTCLDLGCGAGVTTASLTRHFKTVVGLDYAPRWSVTGNFVQGDGVRLPFAAETFEVVVCAQVYEHLADAAPLPGEVARVLKPGGVCFFSGPNKLWPIEPHYRLPFLHWLPACWADKLVQWAGKAERFDIHPWTYWQLRRSWQAFELHDCTLAVLGAAEQFGIHLSLWQRVGVRLFKAGYFLVPNYNWILVKPE